MSDNGPPYTHSMPWSEPTSDPVADIMAMKDFMRDTYGVRPNVIYVNKRTYSLVEVEIRYAVERSAMLRGWKLRPVYFPRVARMEKKYRSMKQRLRNRWLDFKYRNDPEW